MTKNFKLQKFKVLQIIKDHVSLTSPMFNVLLLGTGTVCPTTGTLFQTF